MFEKGFTWYTIEISFFDEIAILRYATENAALAHKIAHGAMPDITNPASNSIHNIVLWKHFCLDDHIFTNTLEWAYTAQRR